MTGRLNSVPPLAAAALVTLFALPSPGLQAQDVGSRFRVLVPDLFPTEDADDDFGKDLAEDLREGLDQLATHEAIDKDEIEDNLDRFDMDMDELNCITTRQLGGQIDAQVAFCANYREVGDDQFELYDMQFVDMATGQGLAVDGFTTHKDDREEAAQRILGAFDRYVQQIRKKQFCFEYTQNQSWEDALRNCNQAIELNPEDTGVRYTLSRIYRETGELEKALDELRTVLEVEPFNEQALQAAGYVATQLDQTEAGREYYGRYLEVNPGAVDVRRKIAYEMYQAGDPAGAMNLVTEGLELESNPELYLDYGNYAFAAASRAMQEAGAQDSGGITPAVAELYREAIDAYTNAFESVAEEMSVTALRNVISAYIQLDEPQNALDAAERFLEAHPEEAPLWAVYADAHKRAGNLDQALEALARVEEIDPDYPNLFARQGKWLLDAGRAEEAVPFLKRAVERGQDPNTMSRLVLAEAHTNGVQKERWNYAIGLLELAKDGFEVGTEQMEELNFWHGYAIYQRAVERQKPETAETARATLPEFRRARTLFESAAGFAERMPRIDINQYLAATDQYIEIQEAVIKRAGGLD